MRNGFCPDVQILQKKTVAWTEAKSEPLSHRRRWEMNSGTELGTSVAAFALLTYFSLHDRKSRL